jgi:hypothetical protein
MVEPEVGLEALDALYIASTTVTSHVRMRCRPHSSLLTRQPMHPSRLYHMCIASDEIYPHHVPRVARAHPLVTASIATSKEAGRRRDARINSPPARDEIGS